MDIKAENSRQSVDLKWKNRKALEEGIEIQDNGDMTVGRNLEVDGNLQVNGDVVDESGNEKYITTGLGFDNAQKILKTGLANGKYIKSERGSTIGFVQGEYGMQIAYSQNGKKFMSIEFQAYSADWKYVLPTKGGTFALLSDIPSLYHHFISLTVSSDPSKFFFFEAVTTDSTPINSINDLFTKLGNNDYIGNGISVSTLHSIHIGTRLEDTYFRLNGTNIMSLMVSTLSSVTDSVTAISVAPRANYAKESPVWNDEEEEPIEKAEEVEAEPVKAKKSSKK